MATANPRVLTPSPDLTTKPPHQQSLPSFWKRHAWTLVSVGIAALSYMVEQIIQVNFDNNTQAIFSLLLVFVGLHIDQRAQAADLFHQLHARFDRLSTDLELLDTVEQLEDHASVKRVLENVRRIEKECQRETLRARKRFVLSEAATKLQDVCGGTQFSTLFWNCEVLRHAVLEMEENGFGLLGLSPWDTDHRWWETPEGSRFFDANVKAKNLGRRIRRIFVCDSKDFSDAFKKTVREHHGKFQEVRLLLESDCPGKLEATAVVDDWLGFQAETDRYTKCDVNNFYLRQDKVHQLVQDLERFWKLAEKNEPLLQEILKEGQV